MSLLTREQLQDAKMLKPMIIAELKKRGIGGYSGMNKPALVELYLSPPSTKVSPGRPKGTGKSPVGPVGTPETTSFAPVTKEGPGAAPGPSAPVSTGQALEWNSVNLNKPSLASLKEYLAKT